MASKTRKKSDLAPAQPEAVVTIPTVPTVVTTEAEAVTTPDIKPAAPDKTSATDAEVIEQLERAARQETTLIAIAEALQPVPPSLQLAREYERRYGQDVEGLARRHGLPATRPVAEYLALHGERLGVETRDDVLCPLEIDGVPRTLGQLSTLLVQDERADLSEQLIEATRRYKESKVARSIIFAFAAARVATLALDEQLATGEGV